MRCNKCGEGLSMKKETNNEAKGRFREQYKCENGHVGWVSGEMGSSADKWEWFGEAFNNND